MSSEWLCSLCKSAGVLAPSGDNTQAWRFEVDGNQSTITVEVDESRDPSPMNNDQVMSRIACGAAIENIAQTASHNGLNPCVEYIADSHRLATIQIEGHAKGPLVVPERIRRRQSNRKKYDGRIISDEEATQLKQTIEQHGIAGLGVGWATDRSQIMEIADIIGSADAQMFGQPTYLHAFLDNVRFDLSPNEKAQEGLPVGSLELPWLEQRFLPWVRHLPKVITKSRLMRSSFFRKSRGLVRSASGIVYIHASNRCGHKTDAQIGQIMQRIWLELTESGYQVQPMMSIPVLNNSQPRFDETKVHSSGIRSAAAIMRFGYGPPATVQAGRLERSSVVTISTDAIASSSVE